MDFQILIDDSLLTLGLELGIGPIENKTLVSIVNDFEDGAWRSTKFNDFIWDNIAETALSYSEREALQSQPASLLRQAAKNLRLTDSNNDIGKGSELAEIVLYGLMKHKYNALPVVPKIFYKQNAQDNAKGADSVHILVEDNEKFSLWLGEAKFYNSIEDSRLDSIIDSVKQLLATNKLKKENSIITNVSDIDRMDISEQLRNTIKEALSYRNSIDTIKPLINVPILLLHECALTEEASEMTPEYMESIRNYHKDRAISYFRKQIKSFKDFAKYIDIQFHLILFPVPRKNAIVDSFVSTVEFHKG